MRGLLNGFRSCGHNSITCLKGVTHGKFSTNEQFEFNGPFRRDTETSRKFPISIDKICQTVSRLESSRRRPLIESALKQLVDQGEALRFSRYSTNRVFPLRESGEDSAACYRKTHRLSSSISSGSRHEQIRSPKKHFR